MNIAYLYGNEDPQRFQFVPIVIGVSGHRDIPAEDIPALKESIKGELNKFRDRCPNSPLLLVTGLAEGADRLVVQCALELNGSEPEKTRWWSIGAVLALPKAEFERDFESETSLAEFRELLAKCAWIQEVSPSGTSKPKCYELVGNRLAMQAQWLIALWDGKESDKKGGTACVVRLFREGIKPPRPILPDTGPVVHILTRRQSNLTETDMQRVGFTNDLPPDPLGTGGSDKDIARWLTVLDRIDEFNCRIRKLKDSDLEGIRNCRAHLNAGQALNDKELTVPALRSSWLQATADYLAMKAQKRRNLQFRVVLVLAVAGLNLEQYYSGPAEGEGWIIAIWLLLAILFGALALVVTTLPRLNAEARYLDYRSLAEACRVQYFWRRSGIDKCAADFHLFDQRDELEWIRQAVRSTELGATEPQEPIRGDRLKNVLDCWITDQINYYSGRTGFLFHKNRATFLNKLALFFLALAGVVMAATFVVQLLSTTDLVKWLQFVYGMLLTWAGATKVYLEVQGHDKHAKSYLRAKQSMEIAEKMISEELSQPPQPGDQSSKEERDGGTQKLLFEIGREALDENGDWVLLHRERPIRLPI